MPEAYQQPIRQVRCDGYEQTAKGSLAWRDALLTGTVPKGSQLWPSDGIGQSLASTLQALGLPRFCKQAPALTDQVVLWILQQANLASLQLAEDIEQDLRKRTEEEQRAREEAAKLLDGTVDGEAGKSARANPGTLRSRPRIIFAAQEMSAWRSQISQDKLREATRSLEASAQEAWHENIAHWTSIEAIFGELASFIGVGYDLSRSILKMTGWENVEKMHKLVAQLPQIQQIVRALGRMHTRENAQGATEKVLTQVSRVIEERTRIEIPQARTETKGITRSADIPRMLPSEAMLLRHPQFRKLWKLRLLERSLATYKVTGFGEQAQRRESTEAQEIERHQKLERGPIMLCLDTSGSMQGTPEFVAKAIALETMRLAHAEKRRCMLYAFSGPGDVYSEELTLDEQGLLQLIKFLGCSFHGGTDISAPLDQAISRLDQAEWKRADLIIVTDGEIPHDITSIRKIKQAKIAASLRVHGLIIGRAGQGIMHDLCDPGHLHHFSDWEYVRI